MDEWLARALTVIYPTFIVCCSGLVAYWMKLRHERRMITGKPAELGRLEEELEAGRRGSSGRLAELEERLDFAERLLAQLPTRPALGSDTPTAV
jgi:hypothetical protein